MAQSDTKDKQATPKAWSKTTDEHATDFERPQGTLGLRAGAVAIWLVGFAAEVLGILCATGSVKIGLGWPGWVELVVGLALGLAASLAGALLWKRAGGIRAKGKGSAAPTSSLLSAFFGTLAFVPMVIYFAVAKNASSKMRMASIVGLVVALVVTVTFVAAL